MGIILKNILTGNEKPYEATEIGNIERIISMTRDRSVSHPTQGGTGRGGELHITGAQRSGRRINEASRTP